MSTGFSRQEYWSGLPCPPPGDLLGSGTEPTSLMSNLRGQVGSLPLAAPGKPMHGPLVYFHILATVNNAGLNTSVQISL